MNKEKTENKEMSESMRQDVSSVLNEYILKHYKNNLWFLKNMLLKRGVPMENFYVEEALQKVYIWLFLHPENTLEFYKKGDLDNLVGSVLSNWWTLRNIIRSSSQNFYISEYEVDEDKMDLFVYEEDECFDNNAMSPHMSLEERLEHHSIALEETKQWLQDNDTKTSEAIKIVKKRHGEMTYNVALHYLATPSYKFLQNNKEVFGLKNVGGNIVKFRNVCEEVFGKKYKKNNIMPYGKMSSKVKGE
jgi:hypothetical protein